MVLQVLKGWRRRDVTAMMMMLVKVVAREICLVRVLWEQ